MLKEYTNIPASRLACVIEESGVLTKLTKGEWKYTNRGRGAVSTELVFMTRTKQKDPVPGDYIVQISKTDVYHCDKKTWEGNWIPKGFYVK
jgi:hypothetical protein